MGNAQVDAVRQSLARSDGTALMAIASRCGRTCTTAELATRLHASKATATTVLIRLSRRGLVDYERYRGGRLTALGERVAASIVRRHRIIEVFATDRLGYDRDGAAAVAAAIEHAVPDEVVERLYVALDCPERCPHGSRVSAPPVEGEEVARAPQTIA